MSKDNIVYYIVMIIQVLHLESTIAYAPSVGRYSYKAKSHLQMGGKMHDPCTAGWVHAVACRGEQHRKLYSA